MTSERLNDLAGAYVTKFIFAGDSAPLIARRTAAKHFCFATVSEQRRGSAADVLL